ncbi:MAG TPA: DUF4244 domain-containing protein [Acidimicrobiales bacterium]|nr:DUF4244 domain-containing protein [Acidimicrobiales bacterium]
MTNIRSLTSPAALATTLLLLGWRLASHPPRTARPRPDDGQATAEYALVLLGAAAIAMAIVSWVSSANPIGGLFDFVLDKVKLF